MCDLSKVFEADSMLRASEWKRNALIGNEIQDKTLGIIGMQCRSAATAVCRIEGDGLTRMSRGICRRADGRKG